MPREPHPYAHVQSDGSSIRAGIYRVVGIADDRVTLLRVADGRNKRIQDGRLVYVGHDEYRGLAEADNPDEPSLVGSLGVTALGASLVFVGSTPETLASVGVDVGGVLPAVLVFVGVLALVVGIRRLVMVRRLRR